MKASNLLLTVLFAATAAIATQAFASNDPAAGQSTLKLSTPQTQATEAPRTVRTARQELAAIEKNLKQIDTQIIETRGQASMAKTTHGSNSAQAASFQALAASLEAQKTQLTAKRSELQNELNAAK